MNIEIRVRPDLQALANHFEEDVTEGFNFGSLVPVITDTAERIFRTEGGGKWPALNEQYAAWKARFYPGAGILVRTGEYFRAATTPGAPYNILEVGKGHITFGVEGIPYPPPHEEGTNRLPARPVFTLLESDEELHARVTQELSNFITEKLTG